jgi:hypothetical protein
MKHVTGFNPSVHCARCLRGSYESLVGTGMIVNEPIPLLVQPGAVLYLCGVSMPYRWQNNLHVAVEPFEGGVVSVTSYTGDIITFHGAREIKFDDAEARRRFPERDKTFLTCRNFQFGAYHFPA